MRTQIEMQYLDKLGEWLSVMETKPFLSRETGEMLLEANKYGCPNLEERNRLDVLIVIFREYAKINFWITKGWSAIPEVRERMNYLYNILSKVFYEFRTHKLMLDEICKK